MSLIGWKTQHVTEISWWIGVVVATGIILVGGPTVGDVRLPPESPFEATRSGHAEQWLFLKEVATIVPEGSSVTIRATDPDVEMSLYMMAVGLVPRATVSPRSYYGRPVAGSESARFVATFGAEPGDTDISTVTIAVAGGFVTDRGSPDP